MVILHDHAFQFLLINFETLACLQVDYFLPKLCVFSFKLADKFFEMLYSGRVNLSGTFSVVRCLSISKKGLFGSNKVKAFFKIPRSRRLPRVGSAKILQNFVFACFTHNLYNRQDTANISFNGLIFIKSKSYRASIYIIQMSSHKTMTLSMESLNKLYFQFFQRIVVPNLSKQVNEVAQLMRQKTAYEVHRFLQETLASPSDNYSTHTNTSINSTTGSVGSINSISASNYPYQYALPSQVDHSKNVYTDNSHAFDKSSDKHIDQSVSFKNKLGMRRVQTGLAFQDSSRPYDPFEYKHIIDDNLMTVPSLSSNASTNEGLLSIPTLTTGISSDCKIDFGGNKEQNDNKKSKIMREQVRKISKVFNQGHSKIQKYTKNGNEAQNKLFNLNISTKLQKREEGTWIKDYPIYQQRQEIQPWKI